MRKLLLTGTTVTALGCLTTAAIAQAPPPPTNVVASGGQSWWGGTFSAYPSPTPEPSTYQAYLRARLAFNAGVSTDSYTSNSANKQNPFQFTQYARMYPTFAGTLAPGMLYGAYMEIRQNSGGASGRLLLPKLALVLGPWARTEFFVNAGRGLHSNDARGVIDRIDPTTGGPASPVPALVRATGYEIGARSEALTGRLRRWAPMGGRLRDDVATLPFEWCRRCLPEP